MTTNDYLKDAIIKKVDDDNYAMVEKAYYLTHRAFVRCDKETTKVHVVFNASTRNGKRPSLYAGPCLLR